MVGALREGKAIKRFTNPLGEKLERYRSGRRWGGRSCLWNKPNLQSQAALGLFRLTASGGCRECS